MRGPRLSRVILVVLLAFGCSKAADPFDTASLSRPITFDEFQRIVLAGAVRVEVELLPSSTNGVAIAAEVEIEQEEAGEDEEIESRALRFENLVVSDTECRGTLILAPNFAVSFDAAATDFEAERDVGLTCRAFVMRVQDALAAGVMPEVEAERDPLAAPQAPDDPAFAAAELELEGGEFGPEVELDVDADNLQPCSTVAGAPAGCLAVLRVLNVPIVLQDDVTEFEADLPGARADFEGVVTDVERPSASCTVGTVTLDDGTVVRLVAATEIENESGDDDVLDDLCEVEDALSAGRRVEAEGEGMLESSSPRTIVAAEVEFELEDEDEDVDREGTVKAGSVIVNADGTGSFVLVSGTREIRVSVGRFTEIDQNSGSDDERLESLAALRDALEDGAVVEARARGVTAQGDPSMLLADEVRLRVRN